MFLFTGRHVLIGLILTCHLAIPGSKQLAAQEGWAKPDWVMTPEQAEDFRKKTYLLVRPVFSSINPNSQQVKQLQDVVRWHLSQLTFLDPANLPKEPVDKLLNDINSFTSQNVKTIMMDEVIRLAPDLMTHPKAIVRDNVVILVSQLSSKQADFQLGKQVPAVPYNPAYKFLVSVLSDSNQFRSSKIAAAAGLTRFLRDGENAPSQLERSEIATALVNQLNEVPPGSDDDTWWYRLRLIEALGYVDRLDNIQSQPIVADALLKVIADPEETWLNRSQGALSLSQLPLTGSVNMPLVIHEVLKLTTDMAESARHSPKAALWRRCFTLIYLSFRPLTEEQARNRHWGFLYQVERPGLSSSSTLVQEAFRLVMPVIKPTLETVNQANPIGPIPEQALTALRDWLNQNPPANRRLVPNGIEHPVPQQQQQPVAEGS